MDDASVAVASRAVSAAGTSTSNDSFAVAGFGTSRPTHDSNDVACESRYFIECESRAFGFTAMTTSAGRPRDIDRENVDESAVDTGCLMGR